MRVVVAMSGGVDSSVAAALLKEKGYDVIGVTMQLWPRAKTESQAGGCCGLDAIRDAQAVAYKLGIPHYVTNFRDIFASKVIADFCREYELGRTPNPCIRCNQFIKFDALLARARELGADFIATGHYARVEPDKTTGKFLLKKGKDPNKDQSYFLYTLTQGQLQSTLFPIGDFTKDKVRKIAAGFGLKVADRPDSQEICFVPDDNYPEFLKEYVPSMAKPGPIIDDDGKILGQHRGIAFYTIGQRKRLGVAAAEPLYVTAIEPERNAVRVGLKEKVYGQELTATDLNWIAIDSPLEPLNVKARTRYRQPEAEATVIPLDNDTVRVKFAEPQMAITPGQAVVFYEGDVVIGGGTIIRQGD